MLDEFVAKKDVQFAVIEVTSDATVELSEIMWKVVFVELDEKAACTMGPPGREELLGSPYCARSV